MKYAVSYREYTTHGEFVTSITHANVTKKRLPKMLNLLLDPKQTEKTNRYYKQIGKIGSNRRIKDIFRTNIMVRDNKGDLVSWKHLLGA